MIIKNAKDKTENGNYDIEYTITNGFITRINTSIMSLKQNKEGNDVFIGNITFDNGVISCMLPVTSPVLKYFEDFYSFLAQIQEDVKQVLK